MASKSTTNRRMPETELWGDDGKIYYAVQNSLRYGQANLRWVLERNPAKRTIVFLYVDSSRGVYLTIKPNPQDKKDANKILGEYMNMCKEEKINTEKLVIKMEDIAKGLKTLISQNKIAKLVMDASVDVYYKRCSKLLSSPIAISVCEEADPSCKIWFMCHGNPIHIREASAIGFDKTPARLHESTKQPITQDNEKESAKYNGIRVPSEELDEAISNAEELGKGGSGRVYKAELWNTTVAIKMLLDVSDPRQRETFQKEVEILGKHSHPNLVRLMGACPEKFALVYEYMSGGDLEEHLDKPNFLWQKQFRIVRKICKALAFLHSPKPGVVIHGDLKPANVLLDKKGNCKLGDFGICRSIVLSSTKTHHTTRTINGTDAYLDPCFKHSFELSPKIDIYAFGMLLLRLLTKRNPEYMLCREVEDALKDQRLNNVLNREAKWPLQLATKLCNLGLRCCDLKPKNRPLASEILMELRHMKKQFSA